MVPVKEKTNLLPRKDSVRLPHVILISAISIINIRFATDTAGAGTCFCHSRCCHHCYKAITLAQFQFVFLSSL